MNKYQKALNEISSAVLDVYADGLRTVTISFTMDGEWRIERKRVLHDIKVIAWMPLPSPYKEENND